VAFGVVIVKIFEAIFINASVFLNNMRLKVIPSLEKTSDNLSLFDANFIFSVIFLKELSSLMLLVFQQYNYHP
jgi:hypothetical protein